MMGSEGRTEESFGDISWPGHLVYNGERGAKVDFMEQEQHLLGSVSSINL